MNGFKIWLWAFLLLLFAGCGGIGPLTVSRDRFDYNTAISDSWKRQMLLNMVKLRYQDAPVFLDVASVISSYSVEGQLNLSSSGLTTAGQTAGVGGAVKYADKPTITYTPLTGEDFIKRLLTPIPPFALLSLVQAGWPVDFVFRACVRSVNGIYNRSGAEFIAHEADPRFYRLLLAFREIQKSSALGLHIEKETSKEATVMFFRKKNISDSTAEEINTVKRLLGLDPQSYEFNLFYGAFQETNKDIAMLSRSMIEIMAELASHIEIPDAHIAAGYTAPTHTDNRDAANAGFRSLFRVRSGTEKPANAFVTVEYEGHWFWIDKADPPSKRTFSLLLFLFRLAESGGGPKHAPLLTVPIG
ncbi:MAG: hypothetical protein JRK53_16435 [Deltaproteobacteria bacterium]|nr:hypothetical protein [Deltaproteobacteria bacterium]MBW1818375.1 hypothetical protein [Deltaproteobacteria bacterium]